MSRRFLHASFRIGAESAMSRLIHGPAAASSAGRCGGRRIGATAPASLSTRASAFASLSAAAAAPRSLSNAAAFMIVAAPIGAITLTGSSALTQANSDVSDSTGNSSNGAKPRGGVARSGASSTSLVTVGEDDGDDGM